VQQCAKSVEPQPTTQRTLIRLIAASSGADDGIAG
jgi:hypothetical protein